MPESGSKIKFAYGSIRHGWATAELSDGRQTIQISPSTAIDDALGKLTWIMVALLEQFDVEHEIKTSFEWVDEPGTWRWVVVKRGAELDITILRFNEDFSRRSGDQGEIIFATTCALLKFAIQVKTALREILEGYSLKEYQTAARWEFPLEKYERLQKLIATIQQKRKAHN